MPDINLLSGFFQQGYLTTDIDRALAHYRDNLGVGQFHVFDTSASHPGSNLMVALGWVGNVMVELIQPRGEVPPVYADTLPDEDFAIRFHHFGYLLPDRERYRATLAALEQQGLPVVQRREDTGSIDLCYFDARQSLGHHLEYVHLFPDGEAFFAQIPRND